MKRHRFLVFLVIAILWVGSLAVVGFIVAPDTPLEQNPQTKDYNSSKSNTTSINIFVDEDDRVRVGLIHLTADGKVQAGTYNGNMVELEFNEFGVITVTESRNSPAFDGLVLAALYEALSVWEEVMTTGVSEIEIAVEKVERS